VEVPFGRRTLGGVVVELADASDVERTKPIKSVMETYLSEALLELAGWMASYYGCSLGEAVQAALPSSVRRAKKREKFEGLVRIARIEGGVDTLRRKLKAAPRQLSLAERLVESGGGVEIETITDDWGFTTAHIKALVIKGLIEKSEPSATSPLDDIESPVAELTVAQQRALESLEAALASGRFSPSLLHGVTGSGKRRFTSGLRPESSPTGAGVSFSSRNQSSPAGG